MSERSLSRLYRRWTARPRTADVAVLDADALVRLIETGLPAGERAIVAHALSRSSSHSGLLHVLRDLREDSASLVEQAGGRRPVLHPRRGHEGRRAVGVRPRARRWKFAGGIASLAACLMVIVGVSSMHSSSLRDAGTNPLVMHVAQRPDRIFTSSDEIFSTAMGHSIAGGTANGAGAHDHVFRSGFTDS
ncbi:MAG: hypothetical protein WBW61_04280 [Rhodanobacteraceae bacterium]